MPPLSSPTGGMKPRAGLQRATRSQSRAHRINAERRHNRRGREAAIAPPRAPDEPPPF